MPLVLTSQEKKVLGFILLMVALGLVMLGVRSILSSQKGTKGKPMAVMPTTAPKTP